MFQKFSKQSGFGIKMLVGAVAVAGLAAVSFPKYNEMLVKSKMTEALTLAAEYSTKAIKG